VIVVFDSGVWISAIARRGVPLAAIMHGIEMDSILTCTELEDEVVRVMSEKFGVNTGETRQRLNELLERSARIVVTGRISGICRDPKDDFILECAESGEADLIVTGDKDLLSLAAHGRIEIVTRGSIWIASKLGMVATKEPQSPRRNSRLSRKIV
jgi:putative PIN family toxin of toxin-antitoxin system